MGADSLRVGGELQQCIATMLSQHPARQRHKARLTLVSTPNEQPPGSSLLDNGDIWPKQERDRPVKRLTAV